MKPERQPRNRTAAPQEEENRIAGRNPVMEALKSGTPLDTIYMSGKQGILGQIAQLAADQGIPVKIVSDARLSQMTRQTHQGVVADGACATYASIAEILEYAAEKGEKPLLLICDEIQDPHNLGAILRTAEAAGFHGIILPKRRSASLNATVAKTSAGAVSWVKVARVPQFGGSYGRTQAKRYLDLRNRCCRNGLYADRFSGWHSVCHRLRGKWHGSTGAGTLRPAAQSADVRKSQFPECIRCSQHFYV